jgi:hypothetical protein
MRVICGMANKVSEIWKVPMRYRPLNDGEIWDGRNLLWKKVLAAASTGLDKTIQISLLCQLKHPDTSIMEKLITPPPEKFRDKQVKTIKERSSSFEELVGRQANYDEIRDIIVRTFEDTFGIILCPEKLTTVEERMMQESREMYDNDTWLYNRSERKFVGLIDRRFVGEAVRKLPSGPLLRVTVLRNGDFLEDILFTGSIHASPIDCLVKLEDALKGVNINSDRLEKIVSEFFDSGVTILGANRSFLISTIREALSKTTLT